MSSNCLKNARELGNMGAVYIAMGNFDNAVQCHEQHLGIAKILENKREEARAYSNLGSAYHYHRNFDKAMSYHTHVLELAQELEEKSIEMRAYAELGHAARFRPQGSLPSNVPVGISLDPRPVSSVLWTRFLSPSFEESSCRLSRSNPDLAPLLRCPEEIRRCDVAPAGFLSKQE
uniref:Uncharacterized protein n=1 Tax=Cynoglossus semilaevis TaxID=244447 RepID=A0A3P8WI40_CYNSE